MKRKFFQKIAVSSLAVMMIAAGLLVPQVAYGQAYSVPGDYSTIQSAINAVPAGSTINVAAGTYNETMTWSSKNLTIQGAGADLTTINGGAIGSVLTISGLTVASTLDGFTIKNGSAASGGGIYTSSPLNISNCVFTGNAASSKGGGIYVNKVSPTITNCTFSGNAGSGGAIYNSTNSNTVITNCILWGDTSPEIGKQGNASPVVTYCDVQGGYAGTGNINSDPSFAGASDYSLSSDSPCIDAGNHASSVPTNGGWYRDMGAFEYTGVDCVRSVTGTGELLFGGQAKAKVNVTAQGSLSQITITTHPGEYYPGTEGNTVKRWYEIVATGNGTCDLTLTYLDGELSSETEGNLVLWRKPAGNWEHMGGTVNTGENTVVISGITSFSDWVISDNPSGNPPVPEFLVVVLLSIGLMCIGGLVWYRHRTGTQAQVKGLS